MPFAFENNNPVAVTPGGPQDVPVSQETQVVPGGFAFEKDPSVMTEPEALRPAVENDPAKSETVRELSRRSQLSPAEVEANPEEVELTTRSREVSAAVANSPATRNFIADPANASVAHPEVEQLTAIEDGLNTAVASGRAFAEGGGQAVGMSLRGLGDLFDAFKRTVNRPFEQALDAAGLSDVREALTIELPWWLQPEEILRRPGQNVEEIAKEIGPDLEDRNFVTDVAGGLGQVTTQITVALVTGGLSSGVSLGSLLGQGAAIQADILEEAGVPEEDRDAALFAGAGVTALTERAGLGNLLNRIPASQRNKIFKILVGAGSEGAQEIIEGVLQNLSAFAFADADVPIFEEAQLQEGGVGAAVGAIVSALMPGHTARVQKEMLEEVSEQVQELQLTQQAPEAAAAHLSEVLKETQTSEVFIPAQELSEWITKQEAPKDIIFGLGVQDQIEEAIALGGDVTIGAEPFARHILMSENFKAISDHVRMREDATTVAEAEELEASGIEEELAEIELARDMADFDEGRGITSDGELSPVTSLAQSELGLRTLFQTADEAGFSPKQFENYLVKIDKAKQGAIIREQEVIINRQAREVDTEFQAEKEKVEVQVREHFNQSVQAYRTVNNIGAQRMDRAQAEALLTEMGSGLASLPVQSKNRKIYTTAKSEKGLDVEIVAELNDYEDARTMLADLATTPEFETAVAQETDRQMNQRHGDLKDRRAQLTEAKALLHNNDVAAVLEEEMNALRVAQKQGRLKPKLIRQAAKDRLLAMKVDDAKPTRFLNTAARQGKAAGRALRKGDREAATRLKTQQVLNFHMAKEAIKLDKAMQKQRQFLQKFGKLSAAQKKGLPTRYQEAIKQLLDHVSLKPRLGPKKIKALKAVANRTADPATIRPEWLDEAARLNWRNMTVRQFQELHDTVKELEHKGRTENKAKVAKKQEDVDVAVAQIADGIANNLRPGAGSAKVREARSTWGKWKLAGPELRMTLFNTDTILREIDGFVDLGPAQTELKARYDTAFSEGYRDDQIGYQRRQLKEAQRIKELYDPWTKAERIAFNKKIVIPGVEQQISRNTMLSVMLNMGNDGNMEALVNSKEFDEAEIEAIKNFATERDWKFVQNVWDYLEEFYPEVSQSEQRRRNYTPERVEAREVNTPHGKFRGGYYPIRYDRRKAMLAAEQDVDEIVNNMRFGSFVRSHTRRGHVEARQDNQGHQLQLDLFVINSHVDQLIYDLEVGDALNDIGKILHNKNLKDAFVDAGHVHRWEALDLWWRDVVTREMGMHSKAEASLRWLRNGFTVSKLGWNVGTILLQPLGIIQTSVQVGKRNTMRGLLTTLNNPWTGEQSIFKFVSAQTGFMEVRQETWNKDIIDAKTRLTFSLFDKITPGNTADFIRDSFFFGIKKTQRIADTVTWLAGKYDGMEKFNGDEKLANQHADRMVARSQASGIFGERTPFERGSVSKQNRQSEFVRAFTPLISYFMAKTNVAIERSKKARRGVSEATTIRRKIVEMFSWLSDMMTLYFVEAMLAGLIRGAWPDGDDDETFAEYAFSESVNAVAAGTPVVREGVSEALGFQGGGVVASVAGEFGKSAQQAGQGEVDLALFKSLNNLGGILFKYPSSQINKTVAAIVKKSEGEDISATEFIMGPHFDR